MFFDVPKYYEDIFAHAVPVMVHIFKVTTR